MNDNNLSLLPSVLKNDIKSYAMACGIANEFEKVKEEIHHNIIYSRIGELNEDVLDLLAYDLHVDWYDYSATLEVKRNIIKNSTVVHMHLGTPFAIERVLEDYFGEGHVKEWFEYDGQPYTFRVETRIAANKETLEKFFRILNTIKNARSQLDGFVIKTNTNMGIFYGQVTRIVSKIYIKMDSVKINQISMNTYSGIGMHIKLKKIIKGDINE